VQLARDNLAAHRLGERGQLVIQAQELLGGGHRKPHDRQGFGLGL
jgi:hypothetical protein